MTTESRWRMQPRPGLPFSRPIDVDAVPEAGRDVDIEATTAECAAIATEAGLPAVERVFARLRVERRSGQRFDVSGELIARITQICVVSLEPFDSEIKQPVELVFARPPAPRAPERSSRRRSPTAEPPPPAAAIVGEADPPDPIIDGRIDLGAVAFEFLMLARDLYPRKPGVQFSDVAAKDADDEEPNAFAALQRLKDHP